MQFDRQDRMNSLTDHLAKATQLILVLCCCYVAHAISNAIGMFAIEFRKVCQLSKLLTQRQTNADFVSNLTFDSW